jgi:hypothetical protein
VAALTANLPDLDSWIQGRKVALSIDADFFAEPDEQQLVGPLAGWLADCVAAGVPAVCCDDHVDLVGLLTEPVDIVINFDFHMDLRIEFLHGDRPLMPPQDATVFESVLSSGTAGRYLWAHPASRAREAADVYTAAFVAGKQPVLRNIHCLPGQRAFSVLAKGQTKQIFLCRSPYYATNATDAAFGRLREVITAARSAR